MPKTTTPPAEASITCFDCDTPFSDGPNLKMVMVNAMQAGWGMEQRRGPKGWERFWICGVDRGKKLSELQW
jgi:hypothetical protein